MSWYEGKHAMITGGGSGIGAATAAVLRDKGAVVTISGRNKDKLSAKAKELGIEYQVADVISREQVSAMIEEAEARSGRIDILVNNAGVAEAAPFARTSDALWDRMISVNLTAAPLMNIDTNPIGYLLVLEDLTREKRIRITMFILHPDEVGREPLYKGRHVQAAAVRAHGQFGAQERGKVVRAEGDVVVRDRLAEELVRLRPSQNPVDGRLVLREPIESKQLEE